MCETVEVLVSTGAAKTVKDKDEKDKAKALEVSYRVLKVFGNQSGRFREIYSRGSVPPATVLGVQDDIFLARTTAATVVKNCAELLKFCGLDDGS